MMIKNFDDVITYLDSFSYQDKSLPPGLLREVRLERMKLLLKHFNNPERSFKVIHIAGSKGKGSLATYLSILLEEKGYKTGLYLSPHLISYKERFTLSGRFFDDDFLVEVANKLQASLDNFTLPECFQLRKPSTFEVYTLYAYLLFKEANCEYACLETGIGGRLDATNTHEYTISCLQPIELEHTSILGDTIEKIAIEKSKIIKKNSILFVQYQDERALKVFYSEAKNKASKLYYIKDYVKSVESIISKDKQRVIIEFKDGNRYDLILSVYGQKQCENIAFAIFIASQLGFLTESGIRRLERTSLIGRFDRRVYKDQEIVLDVAHTKNSVDDTINTFKTLYSEDSVCIFGAIEGKDIFSMLSLISSYFKYIIISKPGEYKKSNVDSIYSKLLELKSSGVYLIKDSKEALERALGFKKPILVTGSFYLTSSIMEALDGLKLK